MKSVRAPSVALAGTCSVKWMMPSPAGCFEITATSPGQDTAYVMLVSNPLCEKTQMSAVPVPPAGRGNGIALPPSVQELFVVENAPSAATFKSKSFPGTEIPAVVGSTTTISLPLAAGAALLSAITSSELLGAATTRDTAFDFLPSGF